MLTFAVGVAISPVPIIAVILMLFSQRARVNGPVFLLGWVLALSMVSAVVYLLCAAGEEATSTTTTETVSWGQVLLGVALLLLAARNWRSRPAPGEQPQMPKWLSGVESMKPGRALFLGLLLAGVNPKNLILTVGASSGLALLGLTTTQAVLSLIVFVVVASATIAGPVVYYLVGGTRAQTALENLRDWLTVHNNAVMAVLFLVFGASLISKGLPGLGG